MIFINSVSLIGETTSFILAKMFKIWCLLFIIITGTSSLNIVSRDEWSAHPPRAVESMDNPVPYVVIHNSEVPGACLTTPQCKVDMQSLQDIHQFINGWNDIAYNFAVGGDGNAYEGRGWSTVGDLAPGYNSQSIGICLIGNFMLELPPENQLQTVHDLINYGVELGMISSNYTLIGHTQIADTHCPGDALYAEIQSWDHYSPEIRNKN